MGVGGLNRLFPRPRKLTSQPRDMSAPSTNPAASLAARFLPPLPPLPCPLEYRGPTPWSNWVIKGRLLAGAYPASADDSETDGILTKILELGIDTFVCLQAEFSMATPEAAWRSGQALRPYVKDAQRLLIKARNVNSTRITQTRLDLLHLPIIDGSVTSDHALSRLADDCCQRILNGERLYVHCWGGHGRTGTLVAVMLARLYGLATTETLVYTQAFHDVRKYPQNVRSPQTQVQVEQVKRILAAERIGAKACEYKWPEKALAPEAANEAPSRPISQRILPQQPPPQPSTATVPLYIRPDAAAAVAAKAAAAASALDPPSRTGSLIPAAAAQKEDSNGRPVFNVGGSRFGEWNPNNGAVMQAKVALQDV